MRKVKYILALVALLCTIVMPMAGGSIAYANTSQEACKGVELVGGECDGGAANSQVDSLVNNVVNVLTFIIGIIAVIMIMIGGFKYITSQGDSNSVSSAKNTILYAIIGIVVVVFAQVIVKFVINKL